MHLSKPLVDYLCQISPIVRKEIRAFHQSFCPARAAVYHPMDPEVNVFLHRATGRDLIRRVTKLPLYPIDPDFNPVDKTIGIVIEHVLYFVTADHEPLLLLTIDPAGKQRLIDPLSRLDPDDVRYVCSVRRRRLTLQTSSIIICSVPELSIGIVRPPRAGFASLLNQTERWADIIALP